MNIQVETAHSKGHRRSIRLEGYDYASDGDYFVTIVTFKRIHLFGEIVDGVMRVNDYGKIVKEEWNRSAEIRQEIDIDMDEFVVMPNHIHGIVSIIETKQHAGKGDRPVALTRKSGPPQRSLGSFIGGFKSSVTTRINTLRKKPGCPVWLRNYYEHTIITEKEYENIANYIEDNPRNWGIKDEYYVRDKVDMADSAI